MLWAIVAGAKCVLEFEDGGSGEPYGARIPHDALPFECRGCVCCRRAHAGMFLSSRCGDGDLVVGRLIYPEPPKQQARARGR